MPGNTKPIKRMLREQAAIAYEKDLRQALLPLADAFDKWRRGELDSFELSRLIHQFHDGEAREIWKRWNLDRDPTMAVVYAVQDGILNRDDLPAPLLEYLRGSLELAAELDRMEAQAALAAEMEEE